MRFKADELKERVDLLVAAGAEVIEIDDEGFQHCLISGYPPHIELKPVIMILEEEE